MIDVNKAVRTAFMTALDETITVDGVPVPAYHEENPNEEETLYIIMNSQTEEDNSNKGAFETIGTILIDVVQKTDGVTYDTVDDVAGSIMNLLQPTPQSHGLTDPSGLQVWNLRKLSSQTLTFSSEEGNIMRRLLRYECKVRQT